MITPQKTSGAINGVFPSLVGFALLSLLTVLGEFADASLQAAESGVYSVIAFGAQANGTNDNTQAFQKALDEAGKAGGQVFLPPGQYLVGGSLRIPPGVTLQGGMDSPVWSEPLKGSVILATGGRDQEDAPALFEMGHASAVRGVTVWYPEQKPTDIHAYPWTFHLQGHDNTVENVTLINSYNGIRIGPENNGVMGVEIANEIGERAVLANNEPVSQPAQ